MTSRSRRVPTDAQPDRDLRRAQNRWQNLVVARSAVDPLLTEVIRVRAARHHDCHT